MDIPDDVLRIIFAFLPWRFRCRMISRSWLQITLAKRIRLYRWCDRKRLFAYMRVFGTRFANRRWSSFARGVGVSRRKRNVRDILSWRAAVYHYMSYMRCQGCGRDTKACVFGVRLCMRCRSDHSLKFAYMVNVRQAKRRGVSKNVLRQIAFHKVQQSHCRFWHEIVPLLELEGRWERLRDRCVEYVAVPRLQCNQNQCNQHDVEHCVNQHFFVRDLCSLYNRTETDLLEYKYI